MVRQRIWTQTELRELKRMYETGVPLLSIAEALDRSPSAIRTRAQINQFRRPRWFGGSLVDALQAQAVSRGLDEAVLPKNPTALRVLSCLAETDVLSKPALDAAYSISSSSRNNALRTLKSLGLVFVDDLCSPGEVILTQKAFRSRPELVLTSFDETGTWALPSMATFSSELDTWLPAICRNKAAIEEYRALLIRQLRHAQSGDIKTADFYSIFYKPKQR